MDPPHERPLPSLLLHVDGAGSGSGRGLCRRATADRDKTKSVGDRLSEGLGAFRADTRDAGSGPSPPAAPKLREMRRPEQGSLDALPPPLLIRALRDLRATRPPAARPRTPGSDISNWQPARHLYPA